jgi:hypothetical protein
MQFFRKIELCTKPLKLHIAYILQLVAQNGYVGYKDVLQSWYGFVPNRQNIRSYQSAFTDHDHVRRKINTARVGYLRATGVQ